MNELTTDLKSLHEATLNNLKNSKANNTLRAYKSDFKDFSSFCVKHGLASLPSEPKYIIIGLAIPITILLISYLWSKTTEKTKNRILMIIFGSFLLSIFVLLYLLMY